MTNSKQDASRKTLLSSASLLAAVAATLTGAPAQAQEAEEDAIVVTGSRIPQPNLVTTSPVTQVTAEDITTQGVTRLEDLVNQLPQAFAAQNATVSNGSTGAATVNLRGLGAARTLVLIDGRRMPYGSPNDVAADINSIPGPLVERVEVLTGGSSAVYGSDAVSGVVNFIMRDNFEGVRLDAQYGFYQHNNDYDGGGGYIREVIAARSATNPSQFQLPEDNQDDGYSQEATLILGASTPDQRGNITAFVNYRHNEAILQRDRDFSACALGPQSTAAVAGVPAGQAHWTCGGSSTSFPGRFFAPSSTGSGSFTVDSTTGNTFRDFSAALDQYNFGPLNYYQRPDERYAFGAFGHYEINDQFEVYTQTMFSDYQSFSQIAPSGDFFNTATINCGNPLLSPSQAGTGAFGIGCSPADIASDATIGLYIGRRNVEGGGRQDHLEYQAFRGVVGVRGALTDSWDYDVSAQYSRVLLARVYRNDFSVSRLGRALDVVDNDPGPGVDPQCRSFVDGTDPNCVPYNVFTLAGSTGGVNGLIPGGVSQAALDYLQIPLVQNGSTTQQNVVATVTGDFGFGSPFAEDPISASFGLEYRRDALESTTDTAFSTGDGAGQGGATVGLEGVTDTFDVFGEAMIPLVQGAPFADLISVDLAYRYSEYRSGGNSNSYKIGADWAPVEDIRFRGSFQRAVRAANVIELFAAQGFNLFDMGDDPCDTTDPNADGVAPVANCQGVNPWQLSAAAAGSGSLTSPAGQYNFLQGGNPALEPEVSDTQTYGLVFRPSFLPGFNLSVDYFNIRIEQTVSIVSPDTTVNNCFANGILASCALITRNPGNGRLWTGNGVVSALNTNIGALETSGIDINANYQLDIGSMGELSFNLIGTRLEELITEQGPGLPTYDCVGFYSAACGTPNPEWRHRFRVGWETPWDIELSATWRYYGEVQLVSAAVVPLPGRLDSEFEAQNYFDLAGNWQIHENTKLRFGVNNIMDDDPPISVNVGTTGNGNTYPQTYDALGRWIFAGVTVDF